MIALSRCKRYTRFSGLNIKKDGELTFVPIGALLADVMAAVEKHKDLLAYLPLPRERLETHGTLLSLSLARGSGGRRIGALCDNNRSGGDSSHSLLLEVFLHFLITT